MISHADIHEKANQSFASLTLPPTWKCEGYNTIREDVTDAESNIISIGAIFSDKSTHGIHYKKYRVFYHVPTEKLGLVEKSIRDIGKHDHKCLVSNRTVVQMNDYLQELQHQRQLQHEST